MANRNVPNVVDTQSSDKSRAFRCHLLIARDEEGGYSAIVLNLPGAGSCGDTEEIAIENAREAIAGVLESYLEADEEIPWVDSSAEEIPTGAKHLWITVNA